MTVLQILYSGLGGHSSVAFSLIEADKEQHRNHILIFYGIEEMPEAYVEKCNSLGVEYFFVRKEPGFDRNSQRQVITTLKKNEPDVILLHSVNLIVPVYYYRTLKKTRIITVEHQPNHLKTKREWVWSFLLMNLSKKVVFLTEQYRDQMRKELGIFYNGEKVRVINNGINIEFFKPREIDRPSKDQVLKIGMLARLMDTKDHLTLIRAFKILLQNNNTGKTFQLHIAGEGEMMPALSGLTHNLGLDGYVFFLGMIPEAAAVDFLNDLDLYVHASLGETMSTSIMQAMACGKPIIASEVQGITNMIEEGKTGLLVPALDPTSLAIKLQTLVDNPLLQQSMGANALQHARLHFTNISMLHSYTNLFHD